MKRILFALLIYVLLINCQSKMDKIPEYNVQVCHPANEYEIEFLYDDIKTLEGVPSHLPYGGTSGSWGYSGKYWTEQHGTPIGADIIYYATYEDKFYHLDVDFPLELMKDLAKRAYASDYSGNYNKPLEHYIISEKRLKYSHKNPYDSMTDLAFGFAPEGMVVVWVWYGAGDIIEVGRFQAKEIKDDRKYQEQMFSRWDDDKNARTDGSEERKVIHQRYAKYFTSPPSAKQWDDYRNRYSWRPVISSENETLYLLEYRCDYYNGERERLLQPYIENTKYTMRAVPKELTFFWRTEKKNQFEGIVFFNWEKVDEVFKKFGKTKNNLRLHIDKENYNIEVTLNGIPLKVDSVRIYRSDRDFSSTPKEDMIR